MQDARAAWASPASLPDGEAGGEQRRQAGLDHLCLRPLDRIEDAPERRGRFAQVGKEPGGTWIAVARLPDGPRIDEPATRELDAGTTVLDPARHIVAIDRQRECNMAVPDEDQRRTRQLERRAGGLLAEHVLP